MTFFIAALAFATLFVVQVLIWRIFKPKKQIGLLFALFLGIPGVLLLVSFAEMNEFFPAMVLLLSVAVVYVQSFPGIQAISPSLEMIVAVQRKMPEGATLEDIHSAILTDRLLNDRLEDLMRDGLAKQEGDRLVLTGPGLLMARCFYYYRRILGLKRGDG